MDSGINELPPYLSSKETGGHKPVDEPDYWFIDDLKYEPNKDKPVNTIDDGFASQYHLSPPERELLSSLTISK